MEPDCLMVAKLRQLDTLYVCSWCIQLCPSTLGARIVFFVAIISQLFFSVVSIVVYISKYELFSFQQCVLHSQFRYRTNTRVPFRLYVTRKPTKRCSFFLRVLCFRCWRRETSAVELAGPLSQTSSGVS